MKSAQKKILAYEKILKERSLLPIRLAICDCKERDYKALHMLCYCASCCGLVDFNKEIDQAAKEVKSHGKKSEKD